MHRPDQTMEDIPQGSARHDLWMVWALLFGGLLVTGVAGLYAKKEASARAQQEFKFACSEIRDNILARLRAHEQTLRSSAALFDASEMVTRDEWHRYAACIDLDRRLPGILGLGFSLLVPPEQLTQHLQTIRAEGFPDYHLWPEGEREMYSSIIYLEPFTGRNLRAFGYDMLSEPVRRTAMERARDQNMAALSGKVKLVQELDQDVQAGTLMYMPVYRENMPCETVEQRRAALYGWVYSPYRMNDLMQGILDDWDLEDDKQVHLQIYDGDKISAENLLYSTHHTEGTDWDAGSLVVPIDFAGHRWTLQFTHHVSSSPLYFSNVWFVLSAGTIISLLLSGLVFALLTARARAQEMVLELTTSLRESEQSYRRQFADGSAVMLMINPEDGSIFDANAAAVKFYGYSREKLLAMHIADINTLPASEVQRIMDSVTPERGKKFETQHRLANGAIRNVEISGSRIQVGQREILHVIIFDITERKRAEDALRVASAYNRNLIEVSIDPMVTIGPDGLITDVNAASEAVTGRPRAELIGTVFSAYLTDPEKAVAGFQLTLQNGTVRDYPLEIRHRDGHVTPALFNASVFRDEEGRVVGVFAAARDITERKRAEEALRASEAKFRAIINDSPVPMALHNDQQLITFLNPAFVNTFGYSLKDIPTLVDWWSKAYPNPEYRREVAAIWEAAAAKALNEHTYIRAGEYKITCKDGTVRIAEISGIVSDNNLLATLIDVTERKRAENALRVASAYNRNLIEVSIDPLVTIGPDGRITDVNAATEAVTGRPRAELIGTDFSDYFTEPEKARAGYQQVFRDGIVRDYPLEIRHQNGRVTSVLYNASVFRDEGGHVVGVFAAARDITERKRAEDALRVASAYNRNLIEVSIDPLVTIGPDGRITDVNAATEAVTGRPRAELIGTDFSDYFTEPEKARAGYQQVFRDGIVRDYPLEIRHQNGRVTAVLYNASVFRDEEGRVVGVFAAARDITERKRAEEERASLEIQNRQLQKAESLGRMAGAIAHNFNNHLQAIIGYLELSAWNAPSQTKGREFVEAAIAAARKASEVSSLMLTYIGQARESHAPLDLSEVCRQSLPMLQATTPALTLESDLATPGPTINSNANQIQQILTNLVANAAEALDDGQGRICITVKTVPAKALALAFRRPIDWQPHDSVYACLEVMDTGQGIAQADLEKLFDPFFSTKFTGRGLGLPAVLGIVRAHEGCISVHSTPHQGSVFRVYFPLATTPATPPAETTTAPSPPPEPAAVLLVEDDQTLCTLTTDMLKHLNYTVLEAHHGEEAVDLFKKNQATIRCVLCDMVMPHMNGWATLAALRALQPGLPFVLTSGYDEAYALKGHCNEMPQAYLSKPYSTQTLKEAIDKAVGAAS